MKTEEVNKLIEILEENGYRKFNNSIHSATFYYWKGIKENDEYIYSMEYSFYDWRQYRRRDEEEWGVESHIHYGSGITDMILEAKPFEELERIAENFYKFCKENNISEF